MKKAYSAAAFYLLFSAKIKKGKGMRSETEIRKEKDMTRQKAGHVFF